MLTKNRLPAIIATLKPALHEVAEKGAEMIAADARIRLEPHRLSGRLAGAVHVHPHGGGFYVVAGGDEDVEEYRSRDVFWGHLLEHGTTHSAPQPFLVPAFEENVPAIEAMAAARLRGIA